MARILIPTVASDRLKGLSGAGTFCPACWGILSKFLSDSRPLSETAEVSLPVLSLGSQCSRAVPTSPFPCGVREGTGSVQLQVQWPALETKVAVTFFFLICESPSAFIRAVMTQRKQPTFIEGETNGLEQMNKHTCVHMGKRPVLANL